MILETPEAVATRALVELSRLAAERPDALVSLAAGETYAPFLRLLAQEEAAGRVLLSAMRFTQHDELFDLEPSDPGSLGHELQQCAPLATAAEERRFLPFPSGGSEGIFREHEAGLEALGGVQLQFLGIGSNGNVACCEPGTPFDRGLHRVELTAVTREHIAPRFTGEVPTAAITAGPRSILRAQRVVLTATGAHKAEAVAVMMDGAIDTECLASLLRRHPGALVLLDAAAAGNLDWPR